MLEELCIKKSTTWNTKERARLTRSMCDIVHGDVFDIGTFVVVARLPRGRKKDAVGNDVE